MNPEISLDYLEISQDSLDSLQLSYEEAKAAPEPDYARLRAIASAITKVEKGLRAEEARRVQREREEEENRAREEAAKARIEAIKAQSAANRAALQARASQ